jgi:DNA-binding transcriptional MerR regulator
MEKMKNCLNCGKSFGYSHENTKFCSIDCKELAYDKKIKANKNTNDGQEGKDYIICKLCNNKVSRIYGRHLKLFHEGTSSADYKKMFPGEPLCTSIDRHNISKNGGKFMREDKWRKWASDKMKGDKNINHSSKTTELMRKERSPFSKDFYLKRGMVEDDRQSFIETALNGREFTTNIRYYLDRGFSLEDSKILLKDRQITFSLDKCINKYGPEAGLERWKKRQEKWLSNYKKQNFSKISQKLFVEIYEIIKVDFKEIYFAILDDSKNLDLSGDNHEYAINLKNKIIKPDFFIKESNKIIEFDGVYWHKNNPENKKRETERDNALTSNNFKILHVREDDYYKKPKEVINKCIDFIYEKTNKT